MLMPVVVVPPYSLTTYTRTLSYYSRLNFVQNLNCRPNYECSSTITAPRQWGLYCIKGSSVSPPLWSITIPGHSRTVVVVAVICCLFVLSLPLCLALEYSFLPSLLPPAPFPCGNLPNK